MPGANGEQTLWHSDGPDARVIESGGSLTAKSGSTTNFESGSALQLAGVAVTASAAEINSLSGATATAAEINAAADLSVNGALVRVKKIAITTTPTGAEQDTGFDLPAKAVLLDVFVDVTTAEAVGGTKTLDIGLLSSESGGDADGFAAALSVAATGIHRPGVAIVTGGTETYVGSWTRGLLLTAGAPLAGTNTGSDEGSYYEAPHASTSVTAKSVTYTAASADWTAFRGSIYLVYVEIA